MKFAKKLTVLVLASIPFACGDDSAPIGDDSSSTGNDEDSSDDDPSAVTITTADPDSSSSSSGDPTTMTTVDPDSTSTDDPTDATESSSSSTDPTKGEESSSSSTDPTKGEESSSSSTDPTAASSSESGSSESSTGEVGDCPDEDLGSTVPQTVVLDTTLSDDSFAPSCGSTGAPDNTYLFTAPAAGHYIFTTSRPGTTIDTTVYLLDTTCDGAELACSDDDGVGAWSLTSLDMAADQTVVVVVDGFNEDDLGAVELYIDVAPATDDGGSCCAAVPDVGGCDAAPFETCVCNFNEECCSVEWTDECAQQAVDHCDADCGGASSCFEEKFCNAPGNDCSCFGCIDDGVCADGEDDCTCADCAGEVFCGCNDDGICDPYFEACSCADCADEDVCTAVPAGCSIEDATTFTDAVGGVVADNATLVLPLAVDGIATSGWDVTLTVQITHTYAGDLDIALRSPAGTLIPISSDNGAGADNVYNGTVFSDNAATPINEVVFTNLVVVPTAIPEGAFGAVRGEDPNGNWQLEVGDDAAGDTGNVVGWSLTITPVDPAPTLDPVASFSATPALFFDETAPAVSAIAVDGPARVCDLNVTTNVSHTYSSDMVMTLTSPSGTTTTLASGLGGSNDNVFAGTTWNDGSPTAADNLYTNNVVATPLTPEGALSAFLGEDPTGDWTLTVSDSFATDDGTLNSWSLDITSCDCQ